MDPLPIHLALHGDGWWTCVVTAPTGEAFLTHADAGADVAQAFSRWVPALAEGRFPDAVVFLEEPEETEVRVEAGHDERLVRIVVARDDGQSGGARRMLDFEIGRRELARGIETALWLVGVRGEWSDGVLDWLEANQEQPADAEGAGGA